MTLPLSGAGPSAQPAAGTTAPVFRAFDSSSAASTVDMPAGVVDGDLLVLSITSGSAIGTPTGFTPIGAEASALGGGIRERSFFRIKQSGDADPIDLGASVSSAIVLAYETGTFDASDPIDGTPATNSADSASNIVGSSITTTRDKSMLILAARSASDDITSPPSGMTLRGSEATVAAMFDEEIDPAGATGDRTGAAESTGWVTRMFAINAAVS